MIVNSLKKILHLLEILANQSIFKLKKVQHGKKMFIKGIVKVYGRRGSVYIGDHFTGNSGLRYNPIGMCNQIVFQCINNGTIHIGDCVGISNTCIVAQTDVTIENNVLIGGGCVIVDTDCHSVFLPDRMVRPETNIKTKKVVIRQGAFIGMHSIILKGVEIGANSVIGAGAVVSCNVPENQIWAGNPARMIKQIL